MTTPTWLDPQEPHEPEHSARQIAALLALIGAAPRTVLELGCGAGRVLVPLVEQGHHVVGIDHDAAALERCRARLEDAGAMGLARLVETDLRGPWPPSDAPFDIACILGNTLALFADVSDAVDILRRAAATLRPDGVVVLDDLAHDLWPELVEGRWQSGLSEDGSLQMVWDSADAIFTVREGDRVDPTRWEIGPDDLALRLWTMGSLTLAARLAGLSDPIRTEGGGLLVLRRMGP